MKKINLGYSFFALLLILASCGDGMSASNSGTYSGYQSGKKSTAAPSGETLYMTYCKLCHGTNGKLGLNGSKDLTQSALTLAERIEMVTNGKNLMTPFGEILSKKEIEAVAKFSLTFNESLSDE